jgi:hypothetical protein
MHIRYADLGNSLWEWGGSFAAWRGVFALHKDKHFAGTRIEVALFFLLWGFWNMYYYPHLDQWISFTGGLSLVIANCAWFMLMLKYRKERP